MKYHRRISHQFGQGHVTSEDKQIEEINKVAVPHSPWHVDKQLGQRTQKVIKDSH